MSIQADDAHELVPRPGQSPDALGAALAILAPGRLPDMQRTEDEAFAKAVEWESFSAGRTGSSGWPGRHGVQGGQPPADTRTVTPRTDVIASHSVRVRPR